MYGAAATGEVCLDVAESLRELVVRRAECRFRFDPQLAGEVRDREQQVAEFFGCAVAPLVLRRPEFADLFLDFVHDVGGLDPIEADRGDAAADFVGTEEGGHGGGDALEHATICRIRPAVGGAFSGFDDFPLLLDGSGAVELAFLSRGGGQGTPGGVEDMGVAADQFGANGIDGVGELEASVLGGNLGVEDALQEHVAEFLSQGAVVSAIDGFEDFVGFFDQVLAKGGVCLFAIPRAPPRCAQGVHQDHESGECRSGPAGTRAGSVLASRHDPL